MAGKIRRAVVATTIAVGTLLGGVGVGHALAATNASATQSSTSTSASTGTGASSDRSSGSDSSTTHDCPKDSSESGS